MRLDRDGEGVVLEAALTARALGLGEHPGRHAPFLRSIRRAIDYDLVSVGRHDENAPESEVQLLVRRLVPMLSDRLAERLPEPLAREHRRARQGTAHAEGPLERRVHQLARTHQELLLQTDKPPVELAR
jgi:hypothetical protein